MSQKRYKTVDSQFGRLIGSSVYLSKDIISNDLKWPVSTQNYPIL